MALNLSTLTNPATSGDVLAEALTTADFLEGVPVLRNLARGSQKGGDAKQDVALNQPKALPLIDGDGYLYVSGVTGNYASIAHDSSLNLTNQLEVVARVKYRSYTGSDAQTIIAKWAQGDFNFRFSTQGKLEIFHKDSSNTTHGIASFEALSANNISDGDTIWVKATIDATTTTASFNFYSSKDNVKNESDVSWTALGAARTLSTAGGISSASNSVVFGAVSTAGNDDLATGAVLKANYKAAIGGTPVLDVDFTATNVRHGDTKFKCATGQVVTINQSGNDPATIIKKPVLRFDGVNDGFKGLFANQIDGGYMFAAFSVLGDGGEAWGRIISVNKTGGSNDYTSGGMIFSYRSGSTNNLATYKGFLSEHVGLFDSSNGDILSEAKATQSATLSRVNNADEKTTGNSYTIEGDEFNIGQGATGLENAAIDLEFLALFSVDSVPDEATATQIRNYINNRNNVFDLKDGFGYYFYDAQKAPVGAITTGSASWNGRIIGSDNGDTDKYATQSTSNDAPVGSGFVVTFADNSDHLDIPSTTQAGWQVVGTSLGTFAYRVNANAVTELNLLGNFGHANTRQTGDLYGIILLPESATGADIESARKLLSDRGSSDALSATVLYTFWYQRSDIVHFKNVNMSSAVNVQNTWDGCSNMVEFEVTDISNGNNFSSAWKGCSALTSFPAGAKLGTSNSNVNFTSAFHGSGLTSFPVDIDLSKGINFANTWRETALTSFPAIQSTLNGRDFFAAWYFCQNLTSFGAANLNASRYFSSSWQSCANLEDFPALFTDWNPSSITSGVFNQTWDGCNSLTAQSVENILTSIDASGKYATSTGASGGSALADAAIDIDYNVATGSLSAATNAAVTSLKSKGWSIIVNNVTL